MPGSRISRRRFLANTSAAAASVGLTAAVARGTPGANERISIGMIGCGDCGGSHLEMIAACAKRQNAHIVACCDVWQVNLKAMAAKVSKAFGQEPRTFTRFGDLLGQKDIDAVTIATPDFSHGPILVAALKAGKDVYVEKPMTIELPYANDALDLARRNERVVQCGTQYRSSPRIQGVAKEVASGSLGKISRFSTAISFNQPRWKRAYDDCKKQDVDWEAYLLHLPKRAFDPGLLREWHLHRETSNGLPGLWMVHYVDAMALMMNVKYPTTAVSHGGNYVWKDGREHADTFTALLEYPEEFLFNWSMSLGTNADVHCSIYGLNGTIESVNGTLATPEWELTTVATRPRRKQAATQPDTEAGPAVRRIEPVPVGDHMENWLECIRSRSRPRADIQFGHQHAVASIMAAIALSSGRRQRYDPVARTIDPA
jgi:predicted dehydrogenase